MSGLEYYALFATGWILADLWGLWRAWRRSR